MIPVTNRVRTRSVHTWPYEREENFRAQLTTEQVAEIRRRYALAYREGLTKARPPSRSDR